MLIQIVYLLRSYIMSHHLPKVRLEVNVAAPVDAMVKAFVVPFNYQCHAPTPVLEPCSVQ
jgi:hypothetical protein